MKKENQDIEEIDLLELAAAILYHWKLVIAITVLFAGLAFGYCKLLAVPQYQSSSALYVLSKSTSITSLTDLQLGTNLTNDYVEVVLSRPVLDKVIDELNLDETAESLSNRVSLENPTNSRILRITVTDPSPKGAKQIADKIAEVSAEYIAEKMDQDPPNIIQNGYTDGEAVSPRTARTTAIGGMLGFVIICFIICFSAITNDSVMTPEDMEKKIGLNVLGSLPLEDSETNKTQKSRKRKKKSGKNK